MVTAPRETTYQQAGHHVVEENIYRSREQGMLQGNSTIASGTVLGQIAVGAITSSVKAGGNTGNGTVSAVLPGDGVKAGVYRLEMTAATKFDVIDPEGFKLKGGTTAVAYADDIKLTVTAGGTAFAIGDAFDVTVALTNGDYAALDLTKTDGLQKATAILWEGRSPVTGTPERCVVNARDTQVVAELLTWPVGITADQKQIAIRQLAARHIILR